MTTVGREAPLTGVCDWTVGKHDWEVSEVECRRAVGQGERNE